MRYLFGIILFLSCFSVITAQQRIVGGSMATPGEQPWQAFLSVTTLEGGFICGGSLIDKEWILTAAHCVFGFTGDKVNASDIEVILGRENLNTTTGEVLGVSEIIVHSQYDSQTFDFDIALLKLSSTSQQTPIILDNASNSLVNVGTLARVRGWGLTSDGGNSSNILLQTDVPLISNASCIEKYAAIGVGSITNNMLCAGFDAGGKDACQGDSGGPLTVLSSSGNWVQVGIVSNGIGCAVANQPGIYTRVANFDTFISDNVGTGNIDPDPVTPPPTSSSNSSIKNISTRSFVKTGDNVMIAGFIISDSNKQVLIRADAPSLVNQGVNGVLADTSLELYSGSELIASNDDWEDNSNADAIIETGIAPTAGLEAALLIDLEPGTYTAIVRGFQGSTGVALVSVNVISGSGNITNISTRSFVDVGDNIMIAGFIIEQTETVLIRADGASLTNAGVVGALQDPTLELFSGSTMINSNDDWISNQAAIEATGLAPVDDREAAILVTLEPGAYTAIVRGVNGSTGVALVSVNKL